MKLFRNKQTGEIYLCICERENSTQMLSLHDSSFLTAVGEGKDNYEEVNTSPKRPEPVEMTYEFRKTEEIMLKEIQDNLNSDEPLKDTFSVGDILYVPVQGYESPIPFEIVHVDEETRSLYFMSRDILEEMRMDEIDGWMENFKRKLPVELIAHLKIIQHINDRHIFSRLIVIPSIKNMCEDHLYLCKGDDDIEFDKFKTEIGRCKDFNGKTMVYWTDTLGMGGIKREDFYVVKENGQTDTFGYWLKLGVCPIFKLSKDK